MRALLVLSSLILFFSLLSLSGERLYTIAERDSGFEIIGILMQVIGRGMALISSFVLIIITSVMELT